MANNILPTLIVIRPTNSRLYACYMNEPQSVFGQDVRGFVSCREESVFDPFSKIEVEISTSDTRYVHLRFSHTNKYWGMISFNGTIVASSNQPIEDRSSLACTLFEPTFLGNGSFSLTHVQWGRRLILGFHNHITVNLNSSSTAFTSFTFVNWETLVKLPRHVTFKGVNDRYLEARRQDGNWPYLELRGQDPNHENVAYEVFLESDGHVRVRSVHYGRFWRRSPNWIWGDSSDTTGRNRDTLFWPVKIDENTIALRNAGNNRFCRGLSTEGKRDCLNAAVDTMQNETRLEVEELVLRRTITNVRYRLDEARVFDTEPFTAGSGTATNPNDTPSSLAVRIQYTLTTSRTFNYSYSLTVGVSTTITAGVPFIAGGEVQISASATHEFGFGYTVEESYSSEAVYELTVPPRSRARINYVGTRGRCSIPFSYVRSDRRSSNGAFEPPTQNVDGIFEGVNSYSFVFEELPVEPL